MAYDLQLQLALQLDNANLNRVRRQIESSLQGVQIGGLDTKNFVRANAQIEKTSKYLKKGQDQAESFFDSLEGKARGFAAYTVASTAILKLTGIISSATREAIKFETELIKITQVTGDNVSITDEYARSLSNISKQYNVNLSKVAQLTRTLTQTGLSFKEAAKGAEILARTDLLATFENLTSTTEGLIAVMQTFEVGVARAGKVLESINSVSKQFAVESTDIVEAIRRTGGAFSTAGGQIEELIALFTSVRSTTRESAETIATGFRTIFGRLQRPKTIEYFKQLGIQLETAEGQFIGPYQAIEEIGKGLERLGIRAGSIKFAEVVEQIGGIRQISRVVPLLEQFNKSQRALDIANNASVDSLKDVEKAQQGLGFQLGQLQKEFGILISDIINSPSFKFFAEVFINISKAVIRLTSSLQPLLPILATFATFKIGRGLSKLLSGGFSLKGAKEAIGFASGGMVPGTGDRDTVPAMLTPGEFVIRKSAVKAIGANRLAGINKYKNGGPIKASAPEIGITDTDIKTEKKISPQAIGGLRGLMWENDFAKQYGITLNQSGFPDVTNEAVAKKIGGKEAKKLELKYKPTARTIRDYKAGLEKAKASEAEIPMVVREFAEGGMVVTGNELAALTNYIRQGSKGVNKFLAGKPLSREEAVLTGVPGINGMSYPDRILLLDQLVRNQVPSTLYMGFKENRRALIEKGVDNLPEGLVGKSFTFPGFSSTSSDFQAAASFGAGYRGGLMKINTKPDGKGIDVLQTLKDAGQVVFSTTTNEKEFILPRGSSFKVKKSGNAEFGLNLDVQQLAKGGPVGTDTVPALLTPGEFVVNKKSAQSFGYGNLEKINKYADGGYVDIQQFKKGGKTQKATRSVSEERRKQLKEEALARQNAEAGGAGLTRAGRREVGQLARGKDEVDFIAVQEKWTKYIEDETRNAKEIYQAKVKQISDEGGTIQEMSAAIKEYQAVIQTIKNEAKGYQRAEEQAISSRNITESEKEVKTKEAEVSKQSAEAAMPSTKPIEEATKSLADKIKAGGATVYDSLSKLGVSYAEAAIQAQSIASGLANFAGFEINQEALTSGQVKGGQLSAASDVVAKAADPKKIQAFASQLDKVGKILPKSIGGPISKFGGTLLKNADKIAKGAGMAAKALNVLSYLELGGGLIDSLLSTDYSKQRDNFIALGDAAGAAEAAQKAYSQEMLRSIPIIGGFLTGIASYFDILPQNLDATGELIVANAKLEASINGTDREVNKAKKAFADAAAVGDVQGQKDAIGAQLAAVENLQAQSLDVAAKREQSGGPSIASGVTGAAGGALAGAAIGSVVPVIGTGIGAVAGAIIGASASLYASSSKSKEAIIKSYELQAEAIKKGAEIINGVTEVFGSNLVSESKRLAAVGGTYQDAFKNASESIGGSNFDAIKKQLGRLGKNLGKDASADIALLGRESQNLDDNIMTLKGSLADLKGKEKARTEELIASREAEKSIIDTMRDQIVASESARIAQEKLIRQQNIQNAAMTYQIQLMKEMQTAMDGFNEKARDLAAIEDEISNIGTGRLTSRQATAQAGFDPKLYEKSADEIVRSNKDAMKIAADVGGISGQEIQKGQQRVDAISRIKDFKNLNEIVAGSGGKGEKASVEEIQEKISEQLKDQMGDAFDENDPVLKAAIADYSARIQDNITNAAQAEEEARKQATQQSIEIIQQQQEKVKQIADAEKKLQDLKIEQINRQSALAQQVYDTEKEYFEKRMALNDRVEDFLNPIQEGPGKAGAILARGNARADRDRAAMLGRRNKGLTSVGLAGFAGNLGGAVGNVAGRAAGARGLDIAQVQSQIDMLAKTIQDEIGIEEQRLNTLMESAKAQQEYTQALNDAQGDLVRSLVTGTEEEIGNQLNAMNAAAMAAQQGSFAGIPEEMKKDVFALFDQFGDVEIPGLGMTGRDAQRNITKNELMRNFGYDEATAEKLASKAVKDKVPIDEKMAEQIEIQKQNLLKLYEQEKQLKDAQNAIEANNNQLFSDAVKIFALKVDEMRGQAAAAPPMGNAPANAPMAMGNQLPPNQQGSLTAQAGTQTSNPIQVQTQGQQEITVRLPDIQALVNQSITSTIYDTVAGVFKNLANDVRTANNFEDVANAIEGGVEQTETRNMGGAVA